MPLSGIQKQLVAPVVLSPSDGVILVWRTEN
jgi:hypothetical protein